MPLSSFKGEPPPRISAGLDFFDDLLGGGFVEGTLTFLGADPGFGKSRLMLLASSGIPVLYDAVEEAGQRIAERCEELDVDHSKISLWENDSLEALEAHLHDVGRAYCFCVLDSFSAMVRKSGEDEVEAAEALAEIARRTGMPILAIAHVTKDGNLRGNLAVEHAGDCTIMGWLDRERGVRCFETIKNRFGPVPVYHEAVLEREGFEVYQEEDEDDG